MRLVSLRSPPLWSSLPAGYLLSSVTEIGGSLHAKSDLESDATRHEMDHDATFMYGGESKDTSTGRMEPANQFHPCW